MNYFSKYRYAIWTIIVLAVIILTAIVTSIFYNYHGMQHKDQAGHMHNMGKMMHDELGLTAEQDVKFKANREDFFKVSRSLFKQLEEKRILLIEELAKTNPDTLMLYKISDEMGKLHAQLKHEQVNHLLQLRKICTPEQVQKLNMLNKELIGPEGPMRRLEHHKRSTTEVKAN